MEKKSESLAAKALKRYKGSASDSLALSFVFFLLFGASLCFDFLGLDFALLGVLLLGLPSLLSFQLMCLREGKENGLSHAQAFRGFRLYYSFYFGVYRFWISLLRSLLILILCLLILGFPVYYILLASSPSFASEAQEFALLLTQQTTTLQEAMEFYSSAPSLQTFAAILCLSSLGAFGLCFVHEIARNTLNVYIRSILGGAPSRFANALFADFFRQQRKSFYKAYYPAVWPGILLFAFGYGAGASLGFVFTQNLAFSFSFGYLFACLLLAFFLPYFFYVMDEIAKIETKPFLAYSLREAESSLKQSVARKELNDEEIDNLRKSIDEMKKKLDEKDPDEKGGDDQSKGD